MTEISNEQWREAHRIIDQCKKEHALQKSRQMKNFIKKRNRTFWKQITEYSRTFMHVYIDEAQAHYATVFSFKVESNNRFSIKHAYYSENELDDLLAGMTEDSIEDRRRRDDCDCECECVCCEEEIETPKVRVLRMTEYQFQKQVQTKVLDRYSIGLTFKNLLMEKE